MQASSTDSAPRLAIDLARVTPSAGGDLWHVVWRLENLAGEPVEILEAWLPHDRFQAEREVFSPPLAVSPAGGVTLSREVRYKGLPGDVILNAFLILRTRSRGRLWRVFLRMRVECAKDGAPVPVGEGVTTGTIGASSGNASLG